MCKVLIFGGTTEGRELAEYCTDNGIAAAVSVATEYGAELLPKNELLEVLVGRLDIGGMKKTMESLKCSAVIDATHPYAEEVTRNIKEACGQLDIACYRLIRSSEEISGCIKAKDMDELVHILNSSNKTVLSTLGSKELPKLAEVNDYSIRIWIRALPVDDVRRSCRELGFCEDMLILEKGPFTLEQNIAHIKQSGAEILVTKESGAAGGFAEKREAAEVCGTEIIVLARPQEKGFTFEEIKTILDEMR
ncbi:MAG: precorrin-6A reductase [Ruminococcus sp.]|uniref:precorrin-6A reductase n=1 Tax=Ruminococcus sp. TaxID=41978 RepID=UPI001B296A65|nr:precorrin-6A reductase [Ruminococcus sp.]MBO7472597.1 precorrin-6A reductase [Ruminococcus sp.]